MKNPTKTILVSIMSMLFMFSNAQEDVKMTKKEQREAEKTKIKKEKNETQDANWVIYQKIAQEQEFVIEFQRTFNPKTGGELILTPRLNFLYMHGDSAIIQFETSQYLSENGLGGRTINGIVSNYKYNPPKDDKKPIFINFNVSHKFQAEPVNVSITVTKDDVTTITFGTISSVYGTFMPVDKSSINIGVDMWK